MGEERWATLDDLESGVDHRGRVWPAERCKAPECRGRRVTVPFVVKDGVWDAVVQGRGNIVCLSCFDEMAQDLGIDYEAQLLGGVVFVRRGDDFHYR